MKYPFYESVQDSMGNVLTNASVSIYLTGTTSPAKIYDSNGSVKTTVPQLQTDDKGYFWFEVDNADYDVGQLFDIKIIKSGYEDLSIEEIAIVGASNITAGKMIKAGTNGLPAEGTNTDAEVSNVIDDLLAVNINTIIPSTDTVVIGSGQFMQICLPTEYYSNGIQIDGTLQVDGGFLLMGI